jgi:type I restriction enzyme, S subunit
MKFRWETEFKETEIGEIPKEWEVKKIIEISEIGSGSTPSTKVKDYWDGDIPWITPKDLANHDSRFISRGERNITRKAVIENSLRLYPKGTVLLTSRAPIGYVAIAKNPVTTNQGFKNIIPNDGTNSEFLYYLLTNISEYLKDISGGSTFEELTKETLKDVLIPLPPLPEQSRIATVLSWFDDLIEVKKKQNEILEKTATAIFKSWFVDFEPFRDVEFVYSEEVGKEIPKGWEVKKLGEVVRIFKGISYKSDEKYQEYIEGAYVFITLDNFVRGGGFKTEYSWIKSERIKPSHLVKESDLIIALTDMTQGAQVVGAPAITTLPEGFKVGVISLDCMKIDLITEHLKYYLYIYLKNTQEENSTFANGANVLHLIINNFLSGKLILIPPSHILQSFHSIVEPLFQKIILNQKQIMTIRKIRDTLLPLLVFGKLRAEEV